jgi:hypothetical protein
MKKNPEEFGRDPDRVLLIDKFTMVSLKNYKIEYINKEGDVIIHIFVKSGHHWPPDFIDVVKDNIADSGDACETDFVVEVNSWFVKVNNYSVRRFGAEADAAYISSLLRGL